MTTSLVTGKMRDGKTAFLTYLLLLAKQDKGYRVYTNYGVDFSDGLIDVKAIVSNVEEYSESAIGIDEGYMYVDSRNFARPENKFFSYLNLQSAKRKIDILITCHQLGLVDLRIRDNFDYIYKCVAMVLEGKWLRRATIEELENYRCDAIHVWRYSVRDEKLTEMLFDPSGIFGRFDSSEVVDIFANDRGGWKN